MKNKQFLQFLVEKNACADAIEWVGARNLKQVWDECQRGDWMMWLVAKSGKYTLQQITKIKVEQARLVQHLMKDKRSLAALDVADRFSEGLATRADLNAAAAYAYAAAAYAADAAAYAAAAAAAYAAYAAAAAAAAAAAYAAYAAADTRTSTFLKTAEICRKHIKEIEL